MPVTAQESFADLAFPQKGIDLSEGFNSQLPGSTPIAVNVRLFEAMTERARGGSRAGLAKYIAAQLPPGAHLIQHLNVIVDPQNIATLDEDDGTFADPSDAGPSYAWGVTQNSRIPSGGRLVRRGGSGRMSFKNRKKLLTITANDISKSAGATYTFNGTEYSASGLDIADSISGITLTSSGAPAGAANGPYPIIPSAVSISGPGSVSYKIKYVNGVMTVGATLVPGIRYVFFDGDHSWGVTVCPPATTATAETCSGESSTVANDIASGFLQSQSNVMGTPGISCGL